MITCCLVSFSRSGSAGISSAQSPPMLYFGPRTQWRPTTYRLGAMKDAASGSFAPAATSLVTLMMPLIASGKAGGGLGTYLNRCMLDCQLVRPGQCPRSVDAAVFRPGEGEDSRPGPRLRAKRCGKFQASYETRVAAAARFTPRSAKCTIRNSWTLSYQTLRLPAVMWL